MQHALRQPNQLERFLPAEEAASIRQVMPEQWCLANAEELEEASKLVRAEGDAFVAKNVLRPRTGSGPTQVPAFSIACSEGMFKRVGEPGYLI